MSSKRVFLLKWYPMNIPIMQRRKVGQMLELNLFEYSCSNRVNG
jgi:hypothetical protein